MATFLFLVSLSATTLLLLAVAAGEIARITRGLFARGHSARHSLSLVSNAGTPQLQQRAAATQSRPMQTAPTDWVPDRAA